MSLHLWFRRLKSIGIGNRSAVSAPRTSRRHQGAVRAVPQLELLEGRVLPTTTVQLNVGSLLNADVVVKYGSGGVLPATSPVDQNLPGGDWSFLTQSAANQLAPSGIMGLPDNGLFPADAFHPAVQLNYNLPDQGPNARRQEQDTSSARFHIPAASYNQLHFFATAGTGVAAFQVKLGYTDGTTAVSPVFTVPDWNSSITESSSGYYLVNGLSRVSPNGTTVDATNGNHFSIFGFEYDPDPMKAIGSITIQPTSVPGTFVFFGATGVTDSTFVGPVGQSVTATAGQPFTAAVASFAAVDPNAQASDFRAYVTWGDGSVSPGTITATPDGKFTVTGQHTYAKGGSDTISVMILQTRTKASITVTSSAQVTSPSLSISPVTVTATEGKTFTGTIASFTGGSPSTTASGFTATISWGDGHISPGVVKPDGSGGFRVQGYNTYAEEGSYNVGVTIRDASGQTFTSTGTAAVADAPLSATGATVTAMSGMAFTGVLAYFVDADPAGTPADYMVNINWGDGTSSPGVVNLDRTRSVFTVSGGHTYTNGGSQAVSVVIVDTDGNAPAPGNATATAKTAICVGGGSLTVKGCCLSATAGMDIGKVTVATFTDSGSPAARKGYLATIDWGDGTKPSTACIVANKDGSFSVVGQHCYAQKGKYTAHVTVSRDGVTPVTGTDTMTVAASTPVVAATAIPGHNPRNIYLLVAYANMAQVKHTLMVNWGDGTQSSVDLGAQPYGLGTTYHDYSMFSGNSANIVVTVLDDKGTPSAPLTLPVSFKTGSTMPPGRVSVGFDAFYGAIASELTAYFHKLLG